MLTLLTSIEMERYHGNPMNNVSYVTQTAALSNLSREDMAIVTKSIGEFFTPIRSDYQGFEQTLLADAEEQTLSSGMFATIWEPADGKYESSVLLVHGWGGNSAQLSGFVRPLLASGKRVVALDMWAHGFSPGVESNCVKFAEGIAEAQAELGPFQHAVGHSLGAAAILIAVYAGCKFDSAVLISTPTILLVMQKFLAHKGASANLLEPFIQMGERYVGKLRSQVDTLLISKYINMPLLLIHDELDRRCPATVSEQLAADAANRKFFKTHGHGHHHIIDAPEVIAKTVEYLTPVAVASRR